MRTPTLSSLLTLTLALLSISVSALAATASSAQTLLDQAKAHLSSGNFNAALDSFDAAIASDPSNYLTYFRRAAVYLKLGKSSHAVKDFDKVLALKPEHAPALIQRAKLLAGRGSLQAAIADLEHYMKSHGANAADSTAAEAAELLQQYKEAVVSAEEGEKLYKQGNHEAAIQHLSTALASMPYSHHLRTLRADAYFKTNSKEMGIADLTRLTQLPDSTDATTLFVRLANLHLEIGELARALANTKECLRLDPDHKQCKKIFRQVKKLDKAITAAEESLNKRAWKPAAAKLTSAPKPTVLEQVEALGKEATPLRKRVYGIMCRSHGGAKNEKETMSWCSKVLEIDPENGDAFMYRAEAKMQAENYEDAMRDFHSASQHAPTDPHRVSSGHTQSQRLHHTSSQKDYYKILGVPRTASKRDIKKAYRKLSMQWHPDKYSGDLSKEEVEKRMGEINEAYTTLSDDEMRKRVDMGEDPNVSWANGFPPLTPTPFRFLDFLISFL
ncbi:uncharacterized protein EV422DRAFT_602214, partial [Fimicolochytrium jonesii]|uniref:uncharacterized protein n=1 Tax=Fimicolochytrium jonesii TaxID=1396493 RepID=UPI0022FDC3A1